MIIAHGNDNNNNNNEQMLISASEVFKELGLPESTLGRVIKTWRKCEFLTLETVAKKVGISKQLLSSYERDERVPSIERMMALSVALDVDPVIFLHFRIQDEIRACGYRLKGIEIEPLDPPSIENKAS